MRGCDTQPRLPLIGAIATAVLARWPIREGQACAGAEDRGSPWNTELWRCRIDSATSAFASNRAMTGDPGSSLNEFLEVTAACGITRVLIEGGIVGFSFALADLSFTPALDIVNDLVSFVPGRSPFETVSDATGCPAGFVAKFRFTARLTDQSTSPPRSDLVVQVKTLTNDNLLHNADGGPGGAGAILTVPDTGQFADRVLRPDEFVDVPFVICLKFDARFDFLVDVLGSIREGMI